MDDRIITIGDDNIDSIRAKYPNGLHFVVGDTHQEIATLLHLMDKIKFDAAKDSVYFVGDYNDFFVNVKHADGLMKYISKFYQTDYAKPGFHLIRGNHEREHNPRYPLENIPDIIVIRGQGLNYFIAHAGMVKNAFSLITADMKKYPDKKFFAYSLSEDVTLRNAPLRQIVYSRRGLHSRSSKVNLWPDFNSLFKEKACIIHGHVPYLYFLNNGDFSYGDKMIFFENQKVWFSEDLCSFDIDSGIKKQYRATQEHVRALSCICLEVIDEIARNSGSILTVDDVKNSINFVFSQEYVDCKNDNLDELLGLSLDNLLNAKPQTNEIIMDASGKLIII